MPDPKLVNVYHPDAPGKTYAIDEADVAEAVNQRGFVVEGSDRAVQRVERGVNEEMYGGVKGAVIAAPLAVARGISGGGSDWLLRQAGVQGSELEAIREAQPVVSTIGEVGSSVLPVGFGGLAARAGARIGRVAEGAGIGKQIAGAAKSAAVEGVISAVGDASGQLARTDDLTVERVFSTLGSNILMGGTVGGVVGGAGKAAGLGLRAAKGKLDDIAARPLGSGVEAGAGAGSVDDIAAYRASVAEANPWSAMGSGGDAALLTKTNNRLRKLMDDPTDLAQRPQAALKALREQETALTRTIARREEVAAELATVNKKIAKEVDDHLATDAAEITLTGKQAQRYGAFADVKVGKVGKVPTVKVTRAEAQDFRAALDDGRVLGQGQQALAKMDGLIEANRALQARITAATTKPAAAAGGLGAAIQDSALGYAVGAAAGVPGLGTVMAAARIGHGLLKKLGGDSAAAAARGSKAIGAFLDVGSKVAPGVRRAAPVLASKVLAETSYTDRDTKPEKKSKSPRDLAASYRARSEEIRSQVAPAPDGSVEMRPEARAKIATRLAPIAAADPLLADKLETMQASKVAFLASKLPRKPDAMGMATGPDRWQPSDMEMRTFARYAAAAEDPMGVVERLSDGSITPEDAETMKTLYPETYADIVMQIVSQLPTLRKTLPYQRRLALSMFAGVAVDPTMDPKVLSQLQASFAAEEGTEGGQMAPRAQPAFGSVTKPEPTAAQQRGA